MTIYKYKPLVWLPITLSLSMLFVLGLYLGNILEPDPSGDEGLGAHLFQIWMVLEVVLIPTFIIRSYKPRIKKFATILAIQIILVIIVCFPVFYFNW